MPDMSGPSIRPEEEEALLPNANSRRRTRTRKTLFPRLHNWNAHPFWLIPIVMIVSMSRGVTMSPRIQVYKAVACRALNQDSQVPGLDLLPRSPPLLDCSGSDVQARAAKIQASVTTLMSTLSAITTGFWSRFGDSNGRKPIFAVFLVGAMTIELFHVLVMNSDSIFGQHAEKVILLGPIVEGLAGGLSAFNGVVHAYTSDCTRHGSRSKIFSTIQGIVFIGLSLGPWITGMILADTESINNYFYISIALLASTLLYVISICPESRYPLPSSDDRPSGSGRPSKASPLLLLHRFMSALMIPVAMFAPRPVPGNSQKKNYNLTFLGIGLFIYLVSTGVYQSKYLYAQHVYSWTTKQLGHYMSLLWISRAINLLLFLPLLISYLKPKTPTSEAGITSRESIASELRFDRYLAQGSLALDGIADFLVAVTPTSSQVTFIGLSCLSSFTSGGNPALHSLGAVCLHACGYGSEVGALFGGMAVLSAIAHITSPYIYALTYSASVANFPQAIFCLAAGLLTCVVLLLSLISGRPKDVVVLTTHEQTEEEEALDVDEESPS